MDVHSAQPADRPAAARSTSSCMYGSSSITGIDPQYPNASDDNLLRYVIYR